MVIGMGLDSNLSRRDFLKLTALLPAALAALPLASLLDREADAAAPHVFLFIFDAWSARHLSLHGYPRETMPNLTRFAERCLIYHNHHSTASFTVPGTASLLTGLYPWTHRAVQFTAGGIAPVHTSRNMFSALAPSHSTLGYAQNPYADIFLDQFGKYLDDHIPEGQFNAGQYRLSGLPIFQNDARMAFASIESNIIRDGKGASASLFLGPLFRLNSLRKSWAWRQAYRAQYPAGFPGFRLGDLADGVMDVLDGLDAPTLAYFHYFPPHEPYSPTREFIRAFNDDWLPPEKPIHALSQALASAKEMIQNRLRYDQYLASWDAEFARLLDHLEISGLLEKSVVIITSDHGEMFERGEIGHNTFLLSDAVTHVPLLISLPGQTDRRDIHAFTSSVDLLPTIASLVGAEPPPWAEGRPLPGLGGVEDAERGIYAIDAKTSSSFSEFKQFSISLMKQGHRLIHYQYPFHSGFEFYNIEDDPEEMNDLYPSGPLLAKRMKEELLQTIEDFNRPYRTD